MGFIPYIIQIEISYYIDEVYVALARFKEVKMITG
jgi:hypothetical protein